jgi:predicted dehydrogenase
VRRILRGAIIGHGFIAENGHLPAYLESMRARGPFLIEAVADVSSARRELAMQAIPGIRVYEDYRSLLDREGATLDFVDIATPPYEHATIACAALDKGLHVVCEKPLATSIADAEKVIAAARRNERVLFPCHNYKHAPVIKAVRQVLDAGLLGRVRLVTLQTFRNTHAKGVADWRPDWRREQRFSGGGIAMDHGSHTFYLAFDWLGEYPTAITARMSALGDFDTEDNFCCSMTFPGGMASAHLTWTAGVRKVIYTVHGDKGAVRVEDDDVEVALMGGGEDGRVTWELKKDRIASDWMDPSHVVWFKSMLQQFRTAIERKDYVGKDAQDSLRCIELITTAYASARDGSRELPLRSATTS